MQLVEQHVIGKSHPFFDEIDREAFASKNLYNLVNYEIRQHFFATGEWLRYEQLASLLKSTEAYKSLPAKVSQWVIKLLDKNWTSFFAAHREYKENPSKFLGRPALPKYKDKKGGRNILVYTVQALSRPLLRIGQLRMSGLSFILRSKQKGETIDQVRIVPKKTHYVIEVVYSVQEKQAVVDTSAGSVPLYAGIDIGLDNLAVIASNKQGFQPLVVNGCPLKSINQFYNKRKAELQSLLGSSQATSHRIDRLTDKHNRKINHYLHVASRQIIDTVVKEGIGTLVIGKNEQWKQNIEIGKRNNQNFVSIPHARFIDMLTYKAQLVGIKVILTEESYTSKTSFLDNEPIQKHETYLGKRVMRGLFRTAKNIFINADLNAAYNIIRKVAPSAFAKGVEGVVVRPLPLGTN